MDIQIEPAWEKVIIRAITEGNEIALTLDKQQASFIWRQLREYFECSPLDKSDDYPPFDN